MSQTAVALIGFAVLISLVQWSWTVAAQHVDPQLIPACYRRHVRQVRAHTTFVQGVAALLAVGGACLLAV